jgi:reductive dehalogenase
MLWATFISLQEKEQMAFYRFLALSIILPIPYFLILFLQSDFQLPAAIILLIITYVSIALLILPIGKRKQYSPQIPPHQIDERDTMFSRNELIPGSEEFQNYYNLKPENLVSDKLFRSKAGLLQPGSTQYKPIQFASADASFETIEALSVQVSGTVNKKLKKVDQKEISQYIKNWSKKLGAIDCGITELKQYHLYSIGGRKERRNKLVKNNHKYAIAFTVEMNKDMVSAAPSASIVMESAQQYLESGIVALQVASFIRNLGYEARAHIDGNYEVVCPLVARDSGLGEIGRMGLLMTPNLGPRVRISVVTTNLPLIIDKPLNGNSYIDFCTICKKCADACPSQAISFDPMLDIDGVQRWQINQEKCFTLWCALGTDCGRCVSVCPYSHPDNLLHNIVRKGIRNSAIFRKVALAADDYFYGRKPSPANIPKWARTKD